MKSVLMVVTSHGDIEGRPTTGIWFSEFAEPFERMREAGVEITVASPRGGPSPVDPRGYPAKDEIVDARDALQQLNATLPLAAVKADDFDGIFIPGGHGPMFDLATDPAIKALIANFWVQDKAVASVCHGPAALLEVVLPGGRTLLSGRRVTGFTHDEDREDALFVHMPFSLQERMTWEGAEFIAGTAHQPHVERDGRLVTGQNPQSAVQVAEAFLDALDANGKLA
jgi:putative intracellular protease/amidase